MLRNFIYNFDVIKENPMFYFQNILIMIFVLVFSLSIHEFFHSVAAYFCGDNTSVRFNRLSLNPLHHLDPYGTLFIIIFGFGWAKPVPVNSFNFKNKFWGNFFVSIAGVFINLLIYLFVTIILSLIVKSSWNIYILNNYTLYDLIGINQAGSNYILNYINAYKDSLFINNHTIILIYKILLNFAKINLSLAIFNFLPFPPLDGYNFFNNLLFKNKLSINVKIVSIISICFLILSYQGYLGKIIYYFINIIDYNFINFLSLLGI